MRTVDDTERLRVSSLFVLTDSLFWLLPETPLLSVVRVVLLTVLRLSCCSTTEVRRCALLLPSSPISADLVVLVAAPDPLIVLRREVAEPET